MLLIQSQLRKILSISIRLFLGVILGTLVCGDGQSNWYKGIQLLTVYSIIALMFFVIPELAN